METDVHHRFLAEVAPALRLAVRRYVRPVAPEDYHDLTQEGLAIAWRSSLALVRRGRPILPAPIVFYTVRRLRSGRRFLRSGRTDVMSAACQLDGNSRLISIHAEFHSPIDGDQFSALIDRLPDLSADSSAAVWNAWTWQPSCPAFLTLSGLCLHGPLLATDRLRSLHNLAYPHPGSSRSAGASPGKHAASGRIAPNSLPVGRRRAVPRASEPSI